MLSMGFHLLKKFSSKEFQRGKMNWFSDGMKKPKINALSEELLQKGSVRTH
jgi:hypothetical protein